LIWVEQPLISLYLLQDNLAPPKTWCAASKLAIRFVNRLFAPRALFSWRSQRRLASAIYFLKVLAGACT